MSIKLEHVYYTYSPGTAYEIHALEDINLTIPDNQFIGMIGHTGSGKSTLIQHFNGLIRPTQGKILYNGEDIWGEKYNLKKLRSEVGLVFQYPEHQLFEIDVLTDVCFGPKNQGLSQEEAEVEARKALEQVGIPEKLYKKSPFELSGGMSQRAGILMAMILKPDLLLADEPTSALDVTVQKQAVREMMRMRDLYGTGIVVVTHNIGVVEYMADKIAVMYQGKLVEYGDAGTVIRSPQDPYTRKLTDAVLRVRRRQA